MRRSDRVTRLNSALAGRVRPEATLAFRVALTIALVGLGGCSLIFVDGPPSAHASMQQFSCDESKVWPVIDGGLAVLSIVGMATAETKTDTVPGFFGFGYSTNTSFRSEQLLANALGLALYGGSAFIGNRRVDRCRSAYAELRQGLNSTVYHRAVPGGAR